MVTAVALVVGGALLGGCGSEEAVVIPEATAGQVTVLDSDEGRAIVDAGGALVIDVRSLEEYVDGHLVGAQSISIEDEELWATRTESLDRDRPTVVYDDDGDRSSRAAQQLVDAGFTKVFDLGGDQGWNPEDLRVEGS